MLSGNEEVHMHSIFAAMVDHNATAFVSVYPRAQSLFEQLEAVAERFYD